MIEVYQLIETIHTSWPSTNEPLIRWELAEIEITPDTDPKNIVIINSKRILSHEGKDYELAYTRNRTLFYTSRQSESAYTHPCNSTKSQP